MFGKVTGKDGIRLNVCRFVLYLSTNADLVYQEVDKGDLLMGYRPTVFIIYTGRIVTPFP